MTAREETIYLAKRLFTMFAFKKFTVLKAKMAGIECNEQDMRHLTMFHFLVKMSQSENIGYYAFTKDPNNIKP